MATSETIRDIEGAKVQRIQVDDLAQHLATLEQELSEGRSIELVRGNTIVAEVHAPKTPPAVQIVGRPDLERMKARLRDTWGDQVFPSGTGAQWIREDRDARG